MNPKLIAIFLAVIMLMSILPLFFSGTSQQSSTDTAVNYDDAPGFDIIPGAHVNHKFDSIADGLDMTPKGVTAVQYIDVTRTTGTPLEQLIQDANAVQPDSLYNAKITNQYFAYFGIENTFFELHTISPEIVAFSYLMDPTSYNGYQLLIRENGIYNAIGTPLIFGPQDKVEDTIDVLSGSAEKSDEFDHILSYADMDSEFQRVTTNTVFASQYYLDFKRLDNGNYSRTVIYLDVVNSTLEKLTQFGDNSTERSVVYDITNDENITKVVVTGNFYTIIDEPVG